MPEVVAGLRPRHPLGPVRDRPERYYYRRSTRRSTLISSRPNTQANPR